LSAPPFSWNRFNPKVYFSAKQNRRYIWVNFGGCRSRWYCIGELFAALATIFNLGKFRMQWFTSFSTMLCMTASLTSYGEGLGAMRHKVKVEETFFIKVKMWSSLTSLRLFCGDVFFVWMLVISRVFFCILVESTRIAVTNCKLNFVQVFTKRDGILSSRAKTIANLSHR